MKIITLLFILFFPFLSCSDEDSETETEPDPQYTIPSVQTSVTSYITEISATSGGTVTNDGGTNVTERGVCWSNTTNPTINDDSTSDGTGIGVFTSNISNLIENTTYYVRAYATNNEGTSYGDQEQFTTLEHDSVFIGDVELSTQAEVNAFGANNYQIITGHLTIGLQSGDSNITNLSPLSSLISISGKLDVRYCTSLTSLNGLNNIAEVLTLVIGWNDNLLSLEGLNISTVSEDISIVGNDVLNNIDALQNVTSDLNILSIGSNDNLTHIDGLSNITSVLEFIFIAYNEKISNLDGLSNITSSPWDVTIRNNFALTDITGINNISFNENSFLGIWINNSLTNINGLNNITSLNALSISGNDNLTNINGLSNLTSVLNEIDIHENNNLSDFCGITNLIVNGVYGSYSVVANAFNPTEQDIIDGNCSL